MTAVEENTENTTAAEATEEAQPEAPKYPTYRELVGAVWKLAYSYSQYGDRRNVYDWCASGVNEFLRKFNLPELVQVDSEELKDSYLDAWFQFTNWRATEWTDVDDAEARERLVRAVRSILAREEPRSRADMNEWLTELGLEPLKPPRSFGTYKVGTRTTITSEMITKAIIAMYPETDIEVSYTGRW